MNLAIFVPQMSRDHTGFTCYLEYTNLPLNGLSPTKCQKVDQLHQIAIAFQKKVAEYIDSHLKLKASQHPSYIKNTYDFIDKIKDVLIPPNSLLITLDVESIILTFCTKTVWNQSQKDLNLHIWMKMFSNY